MVRVFDLDKGEYVETYACSPRTAVLAAHAQSIGDWNTWDYERVWGHLVRESDRVVMCGSFTTAKVAVPLAPREE